MGRGIAITGVLLLAVAILLYSIYLKAVLVGAFIATLVTLVAVVMYGIAR